MCGETYYSTVAAYSNEEDAKENEGVSQNDLSYFEQRFQDNIDVEEHEHAIYINVGINEGESIVTRNQSDNSLLIGVVLI